MALGFQKFISEVFVNGKFPKILPSENFPLYGMSVSVYVYISLCMYVCVCMCMYVSIYV